MNYAFIIDWCADLRVEPCCQTPQVSRLALFAWRQTQVNRTAQILDDAGLGDLVAKIHDQDLDIYGTGQLTAELRLGLGGEGNHKRVERLMRQRCLQGVTGCPSRRGCTR